MTPCLLVIMVWFCFLNSFVCFVWCHPLTETLFPEEYISAYAHYYYTSHIMLIYTCVTPCIFTCNYLWCLKCKSVAVWFTDDFPDLTYTWINFIQLSNWRVLSLAFHLLYLNNTITQLDVKCLHFIRYFTLPNRGPPPSLNHYKTLADMPTYNLLNVLSVGSFFLWYVS